MTISKDFFGMMYQGSSVNHDGTVIDPYFPIEVGVQRLWDTGAVMTFLGSQPPFNLSGLEGQVALARKTGAKVMYTFGFSGDPQFPPPKDVLVEGSANRPRPEYLEAVIDAILDFSLSDPAHYIDLYECWNEPGISSLYWDGPGGLAALAAKNYTQSAAIFNRIKARDKNSLILSSSINDLLEPSGLAFAKEYCALMRTAPACDGIAFHMYAKDVADIHAQMANLFSVTTGLEHLPLVCTEYGGPWEAFDIFGQYNIKGLVLNGQIPPAPYSDATLSKKWNDMVTRLIAKGPAIVPDPRTRTGCRWNPFKWLRG